MYRSFYNPAVHIITGEIDTGKTAKLLSCYDRLGRGDGFALTKLYRNGTHIGQTILHLSTRESVLFSLKKLYKPDAWQEAAGFGGYSFSKEGMAFAYAIFHEAVRKKHFPLFIDEAGPLELEGRGFSAMLLAAVSESIPLYLVVRANCMDRMLQRFKFRNVTLHFATASGQPADALRNTITAP